MANPVPAAPHARANPDHVAQLRCRVRLADGRTFTGELPAERHRALQLGLLHSQSDGLVELAAGTRQDGTLTISTRTRADHFLHGGNAEPSVWLESLLTLAQRHVERGEEVFVAPAVRAQARGDRHAVTHTRALWVDVDQPGQLHRLWAFLAKRPCHLLVESAGSGGAHAYFILAEALPATRVVEQTGELIEPIERAHLRLIHHLGVGPDGKPNVADLACRDRSRVMRLAGSVNGKTGRYARILEADFELAPYPIATLLGDLPDPPSQRKGRRTGRTVDHNDPYKRISPPEYAELLGGLTPDRRGYVCCPMTDHEDRHPSAHLGRTAEEGWYCFSCGRGGAIYDFASALAGGPVGRELRGDAFRRARAYVQDVFGERQNDR